MPPRKRGRAEMESSEPAQESDLLHQLRNTWEFANVMQYIFIFGKAVKIDEDFDIEDLEAECLSVERHHKLAEIGLNLLKFVSSHRGLTPELFDEYTRRQYVAKAPTRNPFGVDELPIKFTELDIITQLQVLFQLSQWTLIHPDRLREKMPETKDSQQVSWRIEELGYDKSERLYIVLDDNRLYRRTDPAIPPPPAAPKAKPKAKSKAGKAAARASKRRKVQDGNKSGIDAGIAEDETDEKKAELERTEDLGAFKWECIAVTLAEYRAFLDSIAKSKDTDEKALYTRLAEEVLPIIEKQDDDRHKKIARRQKELMNVEKLATAKRSSRLASKHEKEREEQDAIAAQKKREADLVAAKKDAERQKQMDEARQSRMMTREQRLKEREYKRLLHEEELANLSEDSKKIGQGEARISERHLKAEMEKKKKELEKLEQADEWVFDCSVCGVHGENVDDGSHSIACERCNVWQHSACLGVTQAAAEKDDFHFICGDCKRREEDAKKPKIPALKFRLGSSSSPPDDKSVPVHGSNGRSRKRKVAEVNATPALLPAKKVKITFGPSVNGTNGTYGSNHHNAQDMHHSVLNAPNLSPEGQWSTPNVSGEGQDDLVNGSTTPSRSNGHNNSSRQSPNGLQSSPKSSHGPANGHNGLPGPSGGSYTNGYLAHQTPFYPRADVTQPRPQPNPFLNSFDRQRPSSSHSSPTIPSPSKTRPVASPARKNRDIGPLTFPNGHAAVTPVHSAAPTTTTTKPSLSPSQDGDLAQSSPPPPSFPPSSSPFMDLAAGSGAAVQGLSPAKQSPPRPAVIQGLANTPLLPPTARLSPTPQTPNPKPPMKVMTPDQINLANGHANGQGL